MFDSATLRRMALCSAAALIVVPLVMSAALAKEVTNVTSPANESADEVVILADNGQMVPGQLTPDERIAFAFAVVAAVTMKEKAEASLWWLDEAAFATGEPPTGFKLPLQASADVLQVPAQ